MEGSILVVEDDAVTRQLIENALEAEGLAVRAASSAQEAAALARLYPFDVILLDRMLPDGDGLALLAPMRDQSPASIILVSSLREPDEIVEGLDSGADDYVTKPFHSRALVARVKAHLRGRSRRGLTEDDGGIRIGELVVDPGRRDAFMAGKPAGLTRREYELLFYLAERSPRAVRVSDLLAKLWDNDASEKIVAVYVHALRRKIERVPRDPLYLRTIHGFGYALVDPAQRGWRQEG
jgi:DNA-binding response OmpR family regulator